MDHSERMGVWPRLSLHGFSFDSRRKGGCLASLRGQPRRLVLGINPGLGTHRPRGVDRLQERAGAVGRGRLRETVDQTEVLCTAPLVWRRDPKNRLPYDSTGLFTQAATGQKLKIRESWDSSTDQVVGARHDDAKPAHDDFESIRPKSELAA